MSIGPVEYIVVGFPGNEFNGDIAPELAKLVESGTIRLLDLVFIAKDGEGDVVAVEFDEHDALEAFGTIDGEVGGIISQDDIEHAAEALEPNSSAALLIWEDTWAAPFAAALRDSGGVLIEGGRIPHDLIEPALAGARADRSIRREGTRHSCCDDDQLHEPPSRLQWWSGRPSGPGTGWTGARTDAVGRAFASPGRSRRDGTTATRAQPFALVGGERAVHRRRRRREVVGAR